MKNQIISLLRPEPSSGTPLLLEQKPKSVQWSIRCPGVCLQSPATSLTVSPTTLPEMLICHLGTLLSWWFFEQAFTRAVPSDWHALPSCSHMTHSHADFSLCSNVTLPVRFLLSILLTRTLTPYQHFLCPLPFSMFLHSTKRHTDFFFCSLLPPQLECQPQEAGNFYLLMTISLSCAQSRHSHIC